LRNVVVRNVLKGAATPEFLSSPSDRFCDVPVRRVRGGYLYCADSTLLGGAVRHVDLRTCGNRAQCVGPAV
jgi:hypothetical protein